MSNPFVFRLIFLATGTIFAILIGYWQIRTTRELAKAQRESERESSARQKDVRIKILLQALFSYPFAFYVLIAELSSTAPLSYQAVFLISLSMGIIILGALLNTITYVFSSTTNLFEMILANVEKSKQVDQRLREAIAEFSMRSDPEKPKAKPGTRRRARRRR